MRSKLYLKFVYELLSDDFWALTALRHQVGGVFFFRLRVKSPVLACLRQFLLATPKCVTAVITIHVMPRCHLCYPDFRRVCMHALSLLGGVGNNPRGVLQVTALEGFSIFSEPVLSVPHGFLREELEALKGV